VAQHRPLAPVQHGGPQLRLPRQRPRERGVHPPIHLPPSLEPELGADLPRRHARRDRLLPGHYPALIRSHPAQPNWHISTHDPSVASSTDIPGLQQAGSGHLSRRLLALRRVFIAYDENSSENENFTENRVLPAGWVAGVADVTRVTLRPGAGALAIHCREAGKIGKHDRQLSPAAGPD